MDFDLQPTLIGSLVRLRPLVAEDFEEMYHVAGDPRLWEQHPEPQRYRREVFQKFFWKNHWKLPILRLRSFSTRSENRLYLCRQGTLGARLQPRDEKVDAGSCIPSCRSRLI